MAEGNGELIEEMATATKIEGNGETERTSDYPKLVEYGLDKRVSVQKEKQIVCVCIFRLVSAFCFCLISFFFF